MKQSAIKPGLRQAIFHNLLNTAYSPLFRLKHCRYGVKTLSNQSINQSIKQSNAELGYYKFQKQIGIKIVHCVKLDCLKTIKNQRLSIFYSIVGLQDFCITLCDRGNRNKVVRYKQVLMVDDSERSPPDLRISVCDDWIPTPISCMQRIFNVSLMSLEQLLFHESRQRTF